MGSICFKYLPAIFAFVLLSYLAKAQEVGQDSSAFSARIDELLVLAPEANNQIITASKKLEDINKAPGIVSVITADDIRRYGANDLLEVLDRVTSVFMTGTYSNPQNIISVRGKLPVQNNTQVLILLNGRPLRDPYWGGFDFPVFLGFPLEIISRIEVIRGPGSVLYGTNAYAGVVNIITSINPGEIKLQAGTGSFEALQFSGAMGMQQNSFSLSSGFRFFREEGWPLHAIGEAMDTINTTMGENNLGLNLNAQYKGFTLNSFWAYSGQDIIGHAPTTQLPVDVRNRENEGLRGFADLGYTYKFSSFLSSSFHVNINSLSQRTWIPLGQFDVHTRSWLFEQTNMIDVSENLEVVVGTLYYLINGNGEIGDDPLLGAPHFTENLFSSYVQANWSPLDWLNVVGGLQLNKVNGISSNLVPRLGLMGSFFPNFGFKLLYGEAFRAGFPAEKRFQAPPQAVGNPDLAPEEIRTVDGQFYYTSQQSRISLTYFNSFQRNQITRRPVQFDNGQTVLQYINLAQTNKRIHGLELEARLDLPQNIQLEAGLTTQELLDSTTLLQVPRLMVKSGVSYVEPRFGSVGIFNSYFGQATTGEQLNPEILYVNPAASAFHWLSMQIDTNLTNLLALKIDPDLRLKLYAANLLDQAVYYPEYVRGNINTIPGRQGRSFYVTLMLEL
ncbi:MAG: TonB-dependent receptor plug domain-containing protein [Cyclobacteriaceae bacterium]